MDARESLRRWAGMKDELDETTAKATYAGEHLAQLRAENERLRNALQDVITFSNDPQVVRLARDALEP